MPTPKRRGASSSGRPATDWQQAFLFYAGLPPQLRTYAPVAAKFGVTVRTVERHGMNEHWQDQAREIDGQALATAAEEIGRARADQIGDVQKLIEASFLRYAQQLSDGSARVSAADLPRLFKLLTELWADPPTSSAASEVPAVAEPVPLEHIREVLRGLYESGALDPTDNKETA